MSRALNTGVALGAGFPRVSGDEPASEAVVSITHPFSPRERG